MIYDVPSQKVAISKSQYILSNQGEVNLFLDYDLEQLLKILIIVGFNGEEPNPSVLEKIKSLLSSASGESAESTQLPPINQH